MLFHPRNSYNIAKQLYSNFLKVLKEKNTDLENIDSIFSKT